jgi:transcriptional regulator with XRE-family HTH domain
MNDLQRQFGHRVRELRKQMGFSQERLASLAGVDRSYLGQLERGEKNVSLQNMAKIASALGVHLADLFPLRPRRLALNGPNPTKPAKSSPTDLKWGYADAVCVPAIAWIDRHLLTPLYKRRVSDQQRRPKTRHANTIPRHA